MSKLAGLSPAFALSIGIGTIWPVNLASQEILARARTEVGMDGVVLALVSGAAAVLSLTMGLSTTLVGVILVRGTAPT